VLYVKEIFEKWKQVVNKNQNTKSIKKAKENLHRSYIIFIDPVLLTFLTNTYNNIQSNCNKERDVVYLNQGSNSSNNKQVKIDIILDRDRYNNLVDVCSKYKEQHGVELTPKEYILMLIDSAISA
jgi:hypothetical protein